MISIKDITAEQTWPLRSQVLRAGQSITACQWPADDDATTFHLGAFEEQELIGIVTVIREPHPELSSDLRENEGIARIRGMAVHPDHRGQRIGSQLLDACLDRLQREAVSAVWCNARTPAANLYRRRGFQKIGDEFELPDFGPHVFLWRLVSDDC